ncbi:FAD-dependent monooxygenase [Egicoccus sp. AB-alg2]|uniref:FAD-dependent monooxygenase n=1 Tax=Egicoccus sp. AB-alg2 TaxID=3242693 RepID=UPI00359E5800
MSEVLVVGAGPTGLAMAAFLHAHGAGVRVVERRAEPRPSRAFVVQPRTLELLAPLGLADALLAEAVPLAGVHLHAGRRSVPVGLAEAGIRDTAFPYLLPLPQATLERALEAHLLAAGVPVEREVEALACRPTTAGVTCVLRGRDGRRRDVEVDWLVGCDGVDSTVRRDLGIAYPGGEYRAALLLADLQVEGDGLRPDALHAYVGAPGILFLFPFPRAGGWRLLTVAPAAATPGDQVDLATLQAVTDRFTGGGVQLSEPSWTAKVVLRHGQARRYRHGHGILAGDAAHVQSPAGAQGMNTGIQDAANLGWKLAYVATGRAPESLLDTYEAERRPVARRVRHVTDLAFLGEAADLPPLPLLRRWTAPVLLPLVRGRSLPAFAVRLLGGLWVSYRRSPDVADAAAVPPGGVRAGDRLPDVTVDGRRLHEVVSDPGYHLLRWPARRAAEPSWDDPPAHVLVDRSRVPLAVHQFEARHDVRATRPARRRLADAEGAVYLVRPDGHVAYRERGTSLQGVLRHLGDRGLLR